MWVIAKSRLREFWELHADAQAALSSWYHEVSKETWTKPEDVKRRYASASIVGNDRAVFNIKGNRYRLVVKIVYDQRKVYIRFIGTHDAYDRIDAREA